MSPCQLFSRCSAQASHCSAFPVVERAVVHRLSCSVACGNFLDKGLNLSPALVGIFFFKITEPPGKPQALFLREPKAKTSLNLSQLLYPLLIEQQFLVT